ncbi:MAG: AAA family ATPase [Gallionella sp.]|nr:AAA family ATPase [Gallionella sp.]
MDSHFLTEIEIEEFKCFKGFKTSGFRRVNLLGGKNNIGKTALLEAMYINVRAKDVSRLVNAILNVKITRELPNLVTLGRPLEVKDLLVFLDFYKRYSVKSNLIKQDFHVLFEEINKQYSFSVDEKNIVVNASDINMASFLIENKAENITYFSQIKQDSVLSQLFQIIQRKNKEDDLNIFIKEFDGGIERFKVIGNIPQCETNGEYRDISEFGDGLKSYISMICALYACENGYLFVDEIDNGIHYTQLDRLWEIILTLSRQTNCQVFASTHSKEMIDSFVRTAKRLKEQDISYTLLVKNKDQEIKTITRDFAMLLDSMEDEREVR